MPLGNLAGLFASSESRRVYVTAVFVGSAFFEMKTRPASSPPTTSPCQ